MDKEGIRKLINLHELWVSGSPDGVRAQLSDENIDDADFSESNLKGACFTNCSFMRSSFINANLEGAYLGHSNFSLSNLEKAFLDYSDFEEAILQGANLNSCSIKEVNMKNAVLKGSNFFQASLIRSTLKGADLEQASFYLSDLEDCVISSKSDIGSLASELTPEQLKKVIFLDEIFENEDRVNEDVTKRMVVTIKGGDISPYNTSLLLATINAAYNNFFFLINYEERSKDKDEKDSEQIDEEKFTEEGDSPEEEELKHIRSRMYPFYQGVGAKDDIFITEVRKGSQVYEIATALTENFPVLTSVIGIFTVSAASYSWFSVERRKHKELKKLEAETSKLEAEQKKTEQETMMLTLDNTSKILALAKEEDSRHLRKHLKLLKDHPKLEDVISNMPIKSELVKANANDLLIEACQPLLSVNKKLDAYNYTVDIRIDDKKGH